MSLLIDDVLDFARGRMGSGHGDRAGGGRDLGAALSDVVSRTARGASRTRQIDERIDIAGAVWCDRGPHAAAAVQPAGQRADARRARPAGGRGGAGCEQGELAELSVPNGGTPIAPANLAKIFEPYWRPADSRRRAASGSACTSARRSSRRMAARWRSVRRPSTAPASSPALLRRPPSPRWPDPPVRKRVKPP